MANQITRSQWGDKKCNTCIYRATNYDSAGNCCDYILHTGHMRGCPVDNCKKYVEGPISKKYVG